MLRLHPPTGEKSAIGIGLFGGLDLGLALLGTLGLTGLIAFGGATSALQPVRLVIGLVDALYLPGYVLLAALFPGPNDLDWPERSAASVALSFAVVPPIALLLDKLPWGVRPGPILVALDLFVLIGTVVAGYRRWRLPVENQPCLPRPTGRRIWQTGSGRRALAIGGALAAVLALAFASLVVVARSPGPGARPSEFYVVGPDGLAQDYPRRATVGQTISLTIGIVNREAAPTTYRVAVLVGGQPAAWVGPLPLAAGAGREIPVRFTPAVAGDDVAVALRLYRDGDVAPDRSLWLWLPVVGR